MPDPTIPGGNRNYNPGPPPDNSAPYPNRQPAQVAPLNTNFIRTDGYPPQGPHSALQQGRPGTAVPQMGRPGTAGSLAPGQGPIRPSSAAGYGPPPPRFTPIGHRANRSQPAPGQPALLPAGTYPVGPQGPARTGSAMGLGGPPHGQQGMRRPSGGPPGPPGPQQYSGQGNRSPNNPNAQFNRPGPSPAQGGPRHRPPPVDIGFEAPIPQGMASPRPPRSPRPDQMGAPGQRPDRRPSPGPGGLGPRTDSRPGPRPGLPSSPSPVGTSFPKPHSPGMPPHSPGFPPPQHMQEQQGPPPQQQQNVEPQVVTPPQTATPKPAETTQPTPARTHGKGPKTFEEMGVPVQNKEQDCVRISPVALMNAGLTSPRLLCDSFH